MSRSATGPVKLELEELEVELLLAVPRQVREVLLDPERSRPVVDRLFPAAHADPAEEAEHRRLLGTSLYQRRLDTLAEFERSLRAARDEDGALELEFDDPTFDLWMHVINDMRLLLGTELDIRDGDWFEQGPRDDREQVRFQFLSFLSALQESLLHAVGGTPPRS